jgi:hypothetical protein
MLLIVLGIGYYIYSLQIREVSNDKTGLKQVDIVAVKGGLLAIAQSERMYLAANRNNGTLDQLSFPPALRVVLRRCPERPGSHSC